MRRPCRWVTSTAVLLPLALSATPAAAAGGGADTASLVVDRSAWSWRHTLPTAGLPAGEPSQVPAGDLAVASDGDPAGRPAKATYLRLDLSPVPADAVLGALTLTLPIDADARSVAPEGVRLVACRLLSDFTPGEGTEPQAAKEDCTAAPEGVHDATAGTWSFALTSLAGQWLTDPSANHGIVVRPAPDEALPFQVVFEGAARVRAGLTYDLPAPVVDSPPVTAPVAGGGTAVSGSPPLSPLGSGSAPAVDLGPAAAPPMTAPLAAPVAAPVAPAAEARLRPTASARTSPAALSVLGAAVLLLLLAVAFVVDDTQRSVAFARAERARLDRLRLRAPLPAPVLVEQRLPRQVAQTRQGRRPISSATSTVT